MGLLPGPGLYLHGGLRRVQTIVCGSALPGPNRPAYCRVANIGNYQSWTNIRGSRNLQLSIADRLSARAVW